jgi:protein-disulfide isomerase
MKLKRSYIVATLLMLGCLIVLVLVATAFFSVRLIGKHISYIESTLSAEEKSIQALNAIPANQSSLATANPGYVTIQPKLGSDDASLGNANAPVTIVEFADFQCPFCQKFFQDSESEIITKYVNTGKARFIFENFPFLGQESEAAAEAAACAGAQGNFWPYHDYLYAHQSPENSGTLTTNALEHIATTIPGIDPATFNSCLSNGAQTKFVQQQLASAEAEGIASTPTILINGKEYVGVYDTSVYESAIDAALTGK